ncbi:MAG: hypothetical protein PF693_15570 [Spirochaetia bacterium]|nr:hypothetical protein [Spirochaetia bacterium]
MIFKAEGMENKNLIPEIKRSRGYFIYDTKGARYLDFYQDSGRAILGHRMEGITRVVKSTVARGLTAAYPSIYTNRIERVLNLLLPDVAEFRVFRNLERALAAISAAEGCNVSIDSFIDFPTNKSNFGIWRPFLNTSINWLGFKYFIPLLPFPGDFGPVVLAVNKLNTTLAASDNLSPMICDMMVKSISSLIRHIKNDNCIDGSEIESPLWDRIGPYLRFKMEEDEYSVLFKKALKYSILLPPESSSPGIIPCNYEPGQIKEFMKMIGLVESKLSWSGLRPCSAMHPHLPANESYRKSEAMRNDLSNQGSNYGC